MKAQRRAGRVLQRLVIVLAVGGLVVAGGYFAHKYRKRAAAEASLAKGLKAYEARQYSTAAAELGRYVGVYPTNVDALLKYAEAQTQQPKANLQQAVAAWERVLRQQPAQAEAAEKLSSLYLQSGSAVEAERIAKAWFEADGTNPVAKRQLAWALYAQGKELPTALQLVEQVTASSPADLQAPELLKVLLLAGAADVRGGSQPASSSQPATTAPADVELRLRRLLTCKTALVEKVTRYPELPGWRLALASFYRLNGDPRPEWLTERTSPQAEAERLRPLIIEQLQRTAESENVQWEQLVQIGRMWADMGAFDRSAAAFDRVEKLEPTNVLVYLLRCQLAIERDDYVDAAATLDRALGQDLGERRQSLLESAAECYARAGRVADARKFLDEVKSVNAETSVLDYIQACIHSAEGKGDLAVKGFQSAILRFPKFEEAVRQNPKIIRWKLAYARALIATNQADRAIIPLTEFVDLERRRLDQDSRPTVSVGDLDLINLYVTLNRWDDVQQALRLTEARFVEYRNAHSWLRNRFVRQSFLLQAMLARPDGPSPSPAKLKELANTLADAAKKFPVVRDDLQLQTLAAQIDAWLGNVDEAVSKLNELRARSDEKLAVTEKLIGMLEEAGRIEDALRECSEAADSGDAEAKSRFGAIAAGLLIRHGSDADGMAALEKAIGQSEGEQRLGLQLSKARLLGRQNKVAEAADLLLRVGEENPKNTLVREMLLDLPTTDGVTLDRQQIVDQLKKIEGEEGVAWKYRQAVLWLTTDAWTSRKSDIEKLLQACMLDRPTWWEPMRALVLFHERSSTADKALQTAKELIARDTTDETLKARLRLLQVEVAGRAEKWAEADAALDAFPASIQDPAIKSNLDTYRAGREIRRGRVEQAKSILQRQVEETPDNFRARLQLASILRSELQAASTSELADRIAQLLQDAARVAPFDPDVLSARVGFLVSRKQFDEALKLCDTAIQSGQNPDAIRDRSRVWEQQGDNEKALVDLQSYTRVDGRAERAFLALGQFYYRHDKADAAIEAWREGLKHAPKSVELRGALVEVLLAKGGEQPRKEAASLIDSRLAENAEDPDFLMLKGDLLMQDDPDGAARLYEQVTKTTPSAAKAFGQLAQMELARNHIDRATELVDQGLGGSPNSAPLLLLKAGLLTSSSPSEAVSFAAKAAALQPDDERSVLLLAEALSRTGATAEAIQVLETLLGRDKARDSVDVRLNLARLLVQEKRFEDAAARLSEAEKLSPGNLGIVLVRLLLQAARGEWDALVTLAEATLEKHPDVLAVAEAAGGQLLTAEDQATKKRAIPFFERMLARHPDSAELKAALGMACYQVGDSQKAAAILEQAVAQLPGNPELLNNLVWIICEDLKDPAKAERLAAEAIEEGVDYPNLWDTWGVVLYRLGRTKEAVESFDKAEAHPKVTPDTRHSAMFHKARALAATDKQQSLSLLSQLLDAGQSSPALSASEKKEAEELRASLKAGAGSAGSGS